ncbi:helix-turn-helix domain-containing protein [Arthrobacter sp. MAHUQ-56]
MDKNMINDGTQQGDVSASPYLTRKQTAAYLNVSEKWLAQSGRAVGPRFHKFGSQCRYLRSDVINWARQQRATR